MIQEYCMACGAVGSKHRGYRTICDGCGEVIEDSEETVLVHTNTGRQLQGHKRCLRPFEVACSACGAKADVRGVILHDAALHGAKS